MKKIINLFITLVLVIICSFSFVACGKTDNTPDPWDNLGGGGIGIDIPETSIEDTSDYIIEEATQNNTSANETISATTEDYIINLNNLRDIDIANSNDTYSYSSTDSLLTIKKSGTYQLTGTLNGSIEVKKSIGEVNLILSGVTINSTTASAGILVGKDEGISKIITVKNGTTNTINICDANSSIAEKDEEAAIQAKTCNLIINGSGTLNLIANTSGDLYSGIKAKYLTIDNTTININANKNGINSEFQIFIKNEADINVCALGDGIKTNVEADEDDSAEEQYAYLLNCASNPKYGYIYIKNSNITVVAGSKSDYTSSNHGISANNCLYIDNLDSYTINVTTNGGAPTTITETLSDLVAGKALRADGIEYNDSTIPAGYDANYAVIITGGSFILDSCSDAITSQGNLIISGGTFNIQTGDDGIHAEYLTKITSGTINISKSYEGIEGATVEILGGDITIISTDDGINAANSELSNYTYYILISGGNINIDASGDGIDSNGTLKITGGNIFVNGPKNGANAALDADSGILMNGGNTIALGTAGMVETPSSNSTQCFISLKTSSSVSAGTMITIKDNSGNVLLSYKTIKSFQSAIISLETFKLNSTYTITIGSSTYTATLSSVSTGTGEHSHSMPGRK